MHESIDTAESGGSEAEADFDPVFTVDPSDASEHRLTFEVEESNQAWLLLPLGALGWFGRRRR